MGTGSCLHNQSHAYGDTLLHMQQSYTRCHALMVRVRNRQKERAEQVAEINVWNILVLKQIVFLNVFFLLILTYLFS